MTWFDTNKGFVTQKGVARRIILEPNSNALCLVFFERVQEQRYSPQRLMGVSLQRTEDLEGLQQATEWAFRTLWYPSTIINRTVLKDGAIAVLADRTSVVCIPAVNTETIITMENFGGF